MTDETALKKDIAYFMRRLYRQGLTTTSGGNLSARSGDKVLITPSGSDKGRMTWQEIGEMDINGKVIGSPFKPSIESQMHLAIYKNRPDVLAIVHAHPVTASAFAATQAQINTNLLSESYAILGNIAYSDYHCMGSEDLATSVGESSKESNCIIMKNHGALAVGTTLLQAFDRLEVLEVAAKISLICETFLAEKKVELDQKSLMMIDQLMKR